MVKRILRSEADENVDWNLIFYFTIGFMLSVSNLPNTIKLGMFFRWNKVHLAKEQSPKLWICLEESSKFLADFIR